ncbi:Ref family recombination enhancement nuclease [Marinobacterium litorale]|uniref:Ref family recombination enhancement nuclease n=1 Tax=Marinobacterium litorale TaxID=404770 RepID=UPI0004899D7C|nr:Ref family recombination enhancement nuclease [Marinobacterium litorale]
MKKADKDHLNRLFEIGCIACRVQGTPGTPAEMHHPRAGAGVGQKASHGDAIPLCPAHHRGTHHPAVPSIHLDKTRFIERFGTEQELLILTRHALAKLDEQEGVF